METLCIRCFSPPKKRRKNCPYFSTFSAVTLGFVCKYYKRANEQKRERDRRSEAAMVAGGVEMKKLGKFLALCLIFTYLLPQNVLAAQFLIPGGQVVGLELDDRTVCVAAFDDGLCQSAKEAGLQVGDRILRIGKKTVQTPEDVRTALDSSDGSVELYVERDGKEQLLRIHPQITEEGPRLGVFLRRGITGIGTITFYDPDSGRFGSLGHGVNDRHGKLLPLSGGTVYTAEVASVRIGKPGAPGQLCGNAGSGQKWGIPDRNLPQGVFGELDRPIAGEVLPTAEYTQIQPGEATILSTIHGSEVQEYSVEIVKIYPQNRTDGRNMLLKITDEDLLQTTGGIVQGMSGSPIIQDGKLVGAVTHVLVNDPTRGYGIFIENMLDAAA